MHGLQHSRSANAVAAVAQRAVSCRTCSRVVAWAVLGWQNWSRTYPVPVSRRSALHRTQRTRHFYQHKKKFTKSRYSHYGLDIDESFNIFEAMRRCQPSKNFTEKPKPRIWGNSTQKPSVKNCFGGHFDTYTKMIRKRRNEV